MKGLIIAFALFAVCSAQVIKFSKCPEFKTHQNFDPAKYFQGRFYEQKRFWTVFEIGAKCVHADYKVLENKHVEVRNSGFNGTSGRYSQVGDAYCEQDDPAKCHVRFYPGTPYGDYNVLETDYDNYGLVYTCRQTLGGLASLHYAWILTREKQVSDADMKKYLAVYEKNGIDTKWFDDVSQDCPDN